MANSCRSQTLAARSLNSLPTQPLQRLEKLHLLSFLIRSVGQHLIQVQNLLILVVAGEIRQSRAVQVTRLRKVSPVADYLIAQLAILGPPCCSTPRDEGAEYKLIRASSPPQKKQNHNPDCSLVRCELGLAGVINQLQGYAAMRLGIDINRAALAFRRFPCSGLRRRCASCLHLLDGSIHVCHS